MRNSTSRPEHKDRKHDWERESTSLVPLGHVIETPSATTSPDNSDSGNSAYLITGIILAVLIVLSLACAGFFSAVLRMGAQRMSADAHNLSAAPLQRDPSNSPQGLGQAPQQGMPGWSANPGGSATGSISPAQALSYPLAAYDKDLNNDLTAMSYSGASKEARANVSNLVKLDKTHTQAVVDLLNTAARDDSSRKASIDAALDEVHKAQADITAFKPTPISDAEDKEFAKALDATNKRWDAIAAELTLVDGDDDIPSAKLIESDKAIVSTTDEAAQHLMAVLSGSEHKAK